MFASGLVLCEACQTAVITGLLIKRPKEKTKRHSNSTSFDILCAKIQTYFDVHWDRCQCFALVLGKVPRIFFNVFYAVSFQFCLESQCLKIIKMSHLQFLFHQYSLLILFWNLSEPFGTFSFSQFPFSLCSSDSTKFDVKAPLWKVHEAIKFKLIEARQHFSFLFQTALGQQ